MSSEHIFDTPEFEEWAVSVKEELFPKLRASACSVTLYSGAFDAKIAVELGAAILLDKPIIVLASPGVEVPSKLRKVAERVMVFDMNDQKAMDELGEVLLSFVEGLR